MREEGNRKMYEKKRVKEEGKRRKGKICEISYT
jgi:hypothetical protein